MPLKKKTIFALTVKLLLSVTLLHAQTMNDSAKHDTTHLSAYNTKFFLNPQTYKNTLPGNFYASKLPFFCSKELQVQKAVGFAIKFRVGSVQDCDKLEGKDR